MMSPLTIQALRIVHILVSAMWVGTVLFVASFLLPAAKAIGPAGAAMMQELMIARRLPTYILSSGLLTVLSGLALYWNDSAGFSSAWMSSGPARTSPSRCGPVFRGGQPKWACAARSRSCPPYGTAGRPLPRRLGQKMALAPPSKSSIR